MSLRNYLKTMEIPSHRKDLNKHNVEWLIKNLYVKNKSNPNYEEALNSLKAIKRDKSYLN